MQNRSMLMLATLTSAWLKKYIISKIIKKYIISRVGYNAVLSELFANDSNGVVLELV